MQRGTNAWHGSGNVASDVAYGETRAGDTACNFRLVIEQPHKPLSYFRVNAYGRNASDCQNKKLAKGDYVVIDGELMNRQGKEELLTEIRCTEIVIHPRGDKRGGDGNR